MKPYPAIRVIGDPALVAVSIKKARDFFHQNVGKLNNIHTKQFQDGILARIDLDNNTITIQSFEGAYQMFYFDGVENGAGEWAVINTAANIGSASASMASPGRIVDKQGYTQPLRWAMNTTLPNLHIHNVWYGEQYTCLAGAGIPYSNLYVRYSHGDFFETYPKFIKGTANALIGPVGAVAAAYKGGWFLSMNSQGVLTWWQSNTYYQANPPVTQTVNGRTIYSTWRINKDCTKVVGVAPTWTTGDLFSYSGQIIEYAIIEDTTAAPQYRFSLATLGSGVPEITTGSAMAADYQILPDLSERLVVLSHRLVVRREKTKMSPETWVSKRWNAHWTVTTGSGSNFRVLSKFPSSTLYTPIDGSSGTYADAASILSTFDLRKGILAQHYVDNKTYPAKSQWKLFSISDGSVIAQTAAPPGMSYFPAVEEAAYNIEGTVPAGSQLSNFAPLGMHQVIGPSYYLWFYMENLDDHFMQHGLAMSSIPSVGRNCIALYKEDYDRGLDMLVTTNGSVSDYHKQVALSAGMTERTSWPRESFNTTYQPSVNVIAHAANGYAASAVFLWPYEAWRD